MNPTPTDKPKQVWVCSGCPHGIASHSMKDRFALVCLECKCITISAPSHALREALPNDHATPSAKGTAATPTQAPDGGSLKDILEKLFGGELPAPAGALRAQQHERWIAQIQAEADRRFEQAIGADELGGYERGVKPIRNNLREDARQRWYGDNK